MKQDQNTDPLHNGFKAHLRDRGARMAGLWLQIPSSITAEALAYSDFDWLLIDAEHAPNELHTLLPQLQAIAAGGSAPIVRPAWNDFVLLKRLLDIGVRNFLIPFVQNADEARQAVRAVRYPPDGIRGIASCHRGNRYGHMPDYLKRANEEVCVIVQIETRAAAENVGDIASVPGVDAVFVGPADLSASMGHIGNPSHPEVQSVIDGVLAQCCALGTPVGIYASGPDDARARFDAGFRFASIGADLSTMIKACEKLLQAVRDR